MSIEASVTEVDLTVDLTARVPGRRDEDGRCETLAEQRVRTALAKWDGSISPALRLERGEALAECARALLIELEAERQVRARMRADR